MFELLWSGNFSLPSFLVKYAGYKRHGLFLRYYSDSEEKKHRCKIFQTIYIKCYQGQNAIPMLSIPVKLFIQSYQLWLLLY